MVISSSSLPNHLTTRDILSIYDEEVYDDRTEKLEEYEAAQTNYDDIAQVIGFINQYNAEVQGGDIDAIMESKAKLEDEIYTMREQLMSGIDLPVADILTLESELELKERQLVTINDAIDYYSSLYTYVVPVDKISAALSEVTESYKAFEESVCYGVLSDTKTINVPVDGSYYVSSGFGLRVDPLGSGGYDFHRGTDFAANYGTPITALFNGTVSVVATHYGMGNYVRIDHGDGIVSTYLHMSKVDVTEGQIVNCGEKIGEVGSTGIWSTGNHLHLAITINGEYVDPLKLWRD